MAHRTKPFPLEKVRRQVLLNVHVIDKHVNSFRETYLTTTETNKLQDVVGDFLETILGVATPHAKCSIHVQQCKDVLDSRRFTSTVHGRTEFAVLNKVCCAAISFKQLTETCTGLLPQSYNEGLRKYCLSFFSEAQGYHLASVQAYEALIQEQCSTIERSLKRLQDIVYIHDRLAKDVKAYVRDYEKVPVVMLEFCDVISHLGESLKVWVFADRDYIPQLLDESEKLKTQLHSLRRTGKLAGNDCHILGNKLQRISWQSKNVKNELHDEKCKLKTHRQRQKSLLSHSKKTQTLLGWRLQELGQCKERLQGKPEKPYKDIMAAGKEVGSRTAEIDDLTGQMHSSLSQLREIYHEDIRLKKYIYRTRDSLWMLSRDAELAQSKLSVSSAELRTLQRCRLELEQKMAALKRIQYIKLHPETVQKIRVHGYLPHNSETDDQLRLAFTLCADSIGKQWTKLYMTLPFEPDRDQQTRSADIEVILKQTQNMPRDAVVKSLENWQRLSSSVSLGQLVHSLRHLRRRDIVRNVERQLAAQT